jgi:hypothetical protein
VRPAARDLGNPSGAAGSARIWTCAERLLATPDDRIAVVASSLDVGLDCHDVSPLALCCLPSARRLRRPECSIALLVVHRVSPNVRHILAPLMDRLNEDPLRSAQRADCPQTSLANPVIDRPSRDSENLSRMIQGHRPAHVPFERLSSLGLSRLHLLICKGMPGARLAVTVTGTI